MVQRDATPMNQWLGFSVALLLVIAFIGGGGSQTRGWGEALLQLASLPVLVMVGVLALQAPRAGWIALGIALLVPVAVAFQLLPAPAWMESGSGARAPLYEALALASPDGGAAVLRLSLAPWATERGVWALLPALAAFGAALLLPARRKHQISWLLVGLAGFSLLLGFLQLGAPQDSPLNPFPQWAPALGGVFANPNHQATALTIALVLVLSWFMASLRTPGEDDRGHRGMPLVWRQAAAMLLAVLLLGAIPLTGSRAMVLIAVGALLAVPLTSGWLRGRVFAHRPKLGLVMLGGGAVALALLILSVSSWIRVDSELESRGALAKVTASLARDALPTGTGVGSFVPWFDANAPLPLLDYEYFNHAHNEYVQWWLESGVAGLLWIALILVVMTWTFPWTALAGWRASKSGKHPSGRVKGSNLSPDWLVAAAWLAVAVLLAHSAVDYPMRTAALMTAGAWFAGVMVAGVLRRGRVDGNTAQ